MRLLCLNLRHGGCKRIGAILRYLDGTRPDIFVAPEYRHGPTGEKLRTGLTAQGFRSFAWAPTDSPHANGVLIASKGVGRPVRFDPDPADRRRVVGMQLGDLLVIAVYFANLRAKRSLFDYLLALPQVGSDSPCVILGDFNTGCHHIDEPGTILHWADKFEAMSTRGWIDLWRRTHGPDAREFTWVSHVGNGFRLDHAFANPAAAALLDRCDYDHRTRPAISDHSALHLRLENARSRPGISESATQCH